jgi:hypothetical protein
VVVVLVIARALKVTIAEAPKSAAFAGAIVSNRTKSVRKKRFIWQCYRIRKRAVQLYSKRDGYH